MTPRAVAKRLAALLEEERSALRNGQIELLANIAEEKLGLLNALETAPCAPEVLAQLRDEAAAAAGGDKAPAMR